MSRVEFVHCRLLVPAWNFPLSRDWLIVRCVGWRRREKSVHCVRLLSSSTNSKKLSGRENRHVKFFHDKLIDIHCNVAGAQFYLFRLTCHSIYCHKINSRRCREAFQAAQTHCWLRERRDAKWGNLRWKELTQEKERGKRRRVEIVVCLLLFCGWRDTKELLLAIVAQWLITRGALLLIKHFGGDEREMGEEKREGDKKVLTEKSRKLQKAYKLAKWIILGF